MRIRGVELVNGDAPALQPGQVAAVGNRLLVGCGEGGCGYHQIAAGPGKRSMDAAAYLNGNSHPDRFICSNSRRQKSYYKEPLQAILNFVRIHPQIAQITRFVNNNWCAEKTRRAVLLSAQLRIDCYREFLQWADVDIKKHR